MQLSTKTVLFFLACVVCVSITTASYTGTVAFLTADCSGSAGGGSVEINTCTQNGTNVWTINSCAANGRDVEQFRCNNSDCAPTNCVYFQTLPTCFPNSIYHFAYMCYANASVVPDILPTDNFSFSYSVYSDATCTTLEERFWGPQSSCIPGPDANDYTQATCTATGVSMTVFNSTTCAAGTGHNQILPFGCTAGTGVWMKGNCHYQPPTTGTSGAVTTGSTTTGNHTTAGTTGSTGGSTTGSTTGSGTTGTGGSTTTTSSASVLAASTLLFVAVAAAAL